MRCSFIIPQPGIIKSGLNSARSYCEVKVMCDLEMLMQADESEPGVHGMPGLI